MKKFIPLALFLVILSSGCTIPGLGVEIPGLPSIPGLWGPTIVQYEHDIVVIKSLEAVPSEIDAGQTAKILAYIENRGDKKVTGVHVELYDYCEGLFIPKLIMCGNQNVDIRQGTTVCPIEEMLPGEIVPVMWTVCQNKAEAVKVRTICPPDGMKVLVRYPYETTSLTTISLISLEEMQREIIERAYRPTESYIAVGQGPIKPYLTVEDRQPVPVFDIQPGVRIPTEDGSGFIQSTNVGVPSARTVLKLQLKNMGTGQLDTKVPDASGREVIGIPGGKGEKGIVVTGISLTTGGKYDLVAADPAGTECIFANSDIGSAWGNTIVRFVGRETSPYYCKVELSHLKDKVHRTTSRHIRVDIKYDYIITRNVILTVNPKIIG